MGAASSVLMEERKKPIDASDVTTTEEAKAEIIRLRGLLKANAAAADSSSSPQDSEAVTAPEVSKVAGGQGFESGQLQIIDYKGALEQCCDDKVFLKEMLEELHGEVSSKLGKLKGNLKDPMVVKFNAHSIKGVCANFCVEIMKNLAKRLEFEAKPFIMPITADKDSPEYNVEKQKKAEKFLDEKIQDQVATLFATLEKEFLRYEKLIVESHDIDIKKKYTA